MTDTVPPPRRAPSRLRRRLPRSSGGITSECLEGRLCFSGIAAGSAHAEVAARHVFYNHSVYDGEDASATPADDAAVAPDKVALLPGEPASFPNYTSFSRGLNGIMVDLGGLDPAAPAIDVGDFAFRVGNNTDPSSWADAPAPLSVTLRRPDATADVTRITIIWADGAIRNQWLQVTLKATERTTLASDDVFFFGNLRGDTGADASGAPVARVNSVDAATTHDSLFADSPIDCPGDFNRDGRIDASDLAVVRRNAYRRLVLPAGFTGAGMGLSATYFDDPDFGGITSQRVDGTVDFDWGTAAPASDIEPDTYSVRWSGQVRPHYSETYAFHTTSNDGVRLWVDGALLIDNWTNHAATEDTASVSLEAGNKYDLRLEYYQHLGSAQLKLEWSSTSVAREVIPADRLYPAAPETIDRSPVPLEDAAPPVAGEWTRIFSDEFDGDALDSVWRPEQYWNVDHTVPGGGELEAYDATGVSVSGGMLHLSARPDTTYGTPYVSGLVQSGGSSVSPAAPGFSFLHGYMEVRAKLPTGQGIWPAIWMMPASFNDDNGELDVVEMIGSEPTTSNFVVHRHGLDDGHEWLGANLTRTFHTFGVDWEADHVAWYVDGVERARSTDPAFICPEAMYPILNVAVGGNWPGAPDATTPFPATMDVDYVRVWQHP